MRFVRPERKRKVAFDLTSLIDVVFLLLIFFMVTTTFATVGQGIRVNLPTTTTPHEKIEENIVISITEDNQIYVGKKWVKRENLVALLERELKRRGELVVINADKNVLHGKVVEVMDLARQAGAGKLGILTTQKAKEAR